jgi:hypothetical protein
MFPSKTIACLKCGGKGYTEVQGTTGPYPKACGACLGSGKQEVRP